MHLNGIIFLGRAIWPEIEKENEVEIISPVSEMVYRTRAIITHGFCIFYPLFEGRKSFFKEVFSENSAIMYG